MGEERRKRSRSRRGGGRLSRRDDGHHAAQAEAERAPAESVPDHPLIPRGTPPPLDTPEDLAELLAHVREIGSFAYDTEFIGEESYYPRICVVQIATRDRVALIDPLVGLDLTGVWELIADPEVETIVHAGAQDLEPVVRLLDRAPANVFDTQIAAAFVDRPYPLGLHRLVEEFIGIRLGKALTFTRWDRRPLSRVHARYAADDVRYLPAVRERLREALEAADHARWVSEECAGLSEIARYRFDPEARVARLTANRTLKPRSLAVLRALVVVRDESARTEDVPPRTFLKDDVLLRLAREPARSVDRLDQVKGLPRPVIERHGSSIVAATEEALAAPPGAARATTPEETPRDRVRVDGLWALVSAFCRARGIDPSIVSNRREIASSYFAAGKGADDATASWATGWRRELVGDPLESLLAGRASLGFGWSEGALRVHIEQATERSGG